MGRSQTSRLPRRGSWLSTARGADTTMRQSDRLSAAARCDPDSGSASTVALSQTEPPASSAARLAASAPRAGSLPLADARLLASASERAYILMSPCMSSSHLSCLPLDDFVTQDVRTKHGNQKQACCGPGKLLWVLGR